MRIAPLMRSILIFAVLLKASSWTRLCYGLHRHRLLARLLEDASDVRERAVEQSEAPGLHIARPRFQLHQRLRLDLEVREIASTSEGERPRSEA